MSDHELVLELCRRLRLTPANEYDATCAHHSRGKDFYASPSKIDIGWGEGYSGFYIQFKFDPNGNILSHGVWE